MNKKYLKLIGLILITVLTIGSLVGCGTKGSSKESNVSNGEFAEFEGQDLDGNSVDQSLITEHKVTVLNFWFNGCAACVEEMPELEELNRKLKEKNSELIGVNVDLPGLSDISEAKEILTKQGATYRNITITGGDKAVGYMNNLMAFPTTVLVDENGNIIGEPICGSLNEDMMNDILNRIDSIQKI